MIPALNTVVFNEADRILGLLEHASQYCDELVVVDQSSTDDTAAIANRFGARVIRDYCHGTSEPSYQLAADYTSGEWILLLDADEMIYSDKVPELLALDERWDGAALGRATFVDGRRWATGPDRSIRYFRKGTVEYAAGLHRRNVMRPAKALYRTTEPWILHVKTGAEQVLDDARYDRLKVVL